MKKIAGHLILLCCLTSAHAAETENQDVIFEQYIDPEAEKKPEAKPVIGAYKTIAIESPEVQKAAKLAVAKINQGVLAEITSAEAQLVAGTNYRLVLRILTSDAIVKFFRVVVFAPLPGKNGVKPKWVVNSVEDVVI